MWTPAYYFSYRLISWYVCSKFAGHTHHLPVALYELKLDYKVQQYSYTIKTHYSRSQASHFNVNVSH